MGWRPRKRERHALEGETGVFPEEAPLRVTLSG